MNDLSGERFGALVALSTTEVANDGQRIWECQCDCGAVIKVRAGALRSGKTTSCGCQTSKGNLKIRHILEKANRNFQQEYSFDNLYRTTSQHPLRFDFAIFENEQLLALIEYNGRQHYEPIAFFGGVDNFVIQQENDTRKRQYCIDNNIKLFIIKYDENIEERMEEILNELYSK